MGIRMLPAISWSSSEIRGVTTFCACNAPTSISKSSWRGRREWNWVNLSGGHKSLNREARWVYYQKSEMNDFTRDSGRWGFDVNWLILGSSDNWLCSRSVTMVVGWLEDMNAWRPLRIWYWGTGPLW
jgi:hypothetical protein